MKYDMNHPLDVFFKELDAAEEKYGLPSIAVTSLDKAAAKLFVDAKEWGYKRAKRQSND